MNLTPGEFFDRFTILIRKAKFAPEYQDRLEDAVKSLDEIDITPSLVFCLCRLMMVNTDIWNLEGDIRKGKEGILGLVEVGKRAIEIRDENIQRIALVNEINALMGISDREMKIDHASCQNKGVTDG